jgi:formamidopyrimidine-DNA glycosylase
MPEGPEVKTIARTLAHEIVGKQLGDLWHSNYSLRKAVDYQVLKRLKNVFVTNVSCHGKVLFINTGKKPIIVAQLGMTGQLTVTSIDAPVLSHTHIRWTLKNTNKEIRYVDQRRFGFFFTCEDEKNVTNKLGPDPFFITEKDFLPLIKVMKKSHRLIKEVLLDQSIVAGIGNIYASESLFLACINPERRAFDITFTEYKKLVPAIIQILKLAYDNCGTSFSNYVDGSGKKGDNLQFLKVFLREGESCIRCKTTIIKRIKQGGRSTFFCPTCQK